MEKTRKQIRIKQSEWDSTFQMISWWKVDQVRQARVMVVGAGALGNEVLKNLALMNVGNILVVDFDHIEYSNLCRSVLFRPSDSENKRYKADVAAERIKEINPNVKTLTIKGDISADVGLGIFRRMDVVVGCLDNRLARLYLNRLSFKVNKTWIDGAIENLAGQMMVFKPGVSCYECNLSEADWENIKHKVGCPDVARRNSAVGRIPTTPISSSIIAAMQAQEALKVVNGNDEKSLAGKVFYYEGMNNDVFTYESGPLKEDCMSHFEYESIIDSKSLNSNLTIKETLAELKSLLGVEKPLIRLDHRLILEVCGEKSEKASKFIIPHSHFSDEVAKRFKSHPDERVIITKETDIIDDSFEDDSLTLKEIGIPPLHIIRVFDGEEYKYVELTGDESYLSFN